MQTSIDFGPVYNLGGTDGIWLPFAHGRILNAGFMAALESLDEDLREEVELVRASPSNDSLIEEGTIILEVIIAGDSLDAKGRSKIYYISPQVLDESRVIEGVHYLIKELLHRKLARITASHQNAQKLLELLGSLSQKE